MKVVARLSVAAFLALTFAACSGGGDANLTAADASPSPEATAGPSQSASQTPAPAETTAIPGDLNPAPSAEPQVTLPPAAIGEPVVNEGIKVAVVSFREVTTQAGIPGELGGPGVAFDITVSNSGSTTVDLSNVVADLRTGPELTPRIRADRAPTAPFTGKLASNQTATATYAFTVAATDRADVTLILSINAETPVVVFRGSVQ